MFLEKLVCEQSNSSLDIWDDFSTSVDERDCETASANSIKVIPLSENIFQTEKATNRSKYELIVEEFNFAKSFDCDYDKDRLHVRRRDKNFHSFSLSDNADIEDKKRVWNELRNLPSKEIIQKISQA